MIILGIDPGSTRAGYGVIEFSRSRSYYIDGGIVQTAARNKNELLVDLYESFRRVLEQHKPDIVGIEKLYFSKNLKTATEVSQARGVLILCVQQKRIPMRELTPLEVKQGLTGWGRADKKSVEKAVRQELKLPKALRAHDDVFDALATALVTGYVVHTKIRHQDEAGFIAGL